MFQTLFRRLFIVVSVFCFCLTANALTVTNSGKYKYVHGYIFFSGKQSRIYLLNNISNQQVLIDEKRRFDPGASAGWASVIAPKHWSAILLSRPKFKMNCMAKVRSGAFREVCCKRRIRIVPIEKFTATQGLLDGGSFWIAENHSYNVLKKRIKARGVDIIN